MKIGRNIMRIMDLAAMTRMLSMKRMIGMRSMRRMRRARRNPLAQKPDTHQKPTSPTIINCSKLNTLGVLLIKKISQFLNLPPSTNNRKPKPSILLFSKK